MQQSNQPARKLAGRIAVVTGASRGIGRGIAIGLGEAGATVYVTGRTIAPPTAGRPGTINDTAEQITAHGGKGIAVACDHADDAQVDRLFERVLSETGRIDVLVNNAFATGPTPVKDIFKPFWELDRGVWDAMHTIGLRSAYVAGALAARAMVRQRSGLIVNVSSFGAVRYHFNLPYHVGKTATDRMTEDMAYELRPHNVAAVSFWPGLVLTDAVTASDSYLDQRKGDTPLYLGRLVAALAADPNTIHKSGWPLAPFELGREFGIDDPLTEEMLLRHQS
jgi:dehydrogenase/reductase SDR family protein 1